MQFYIQLIITDHYWVKCSVNSVKGLCVLS